MIVTWLLTEKNQQKVGFRSMFGDLMVCCAQENDGKEVLFLYFSFSVFKVNPTIDCGALSDIIRGSEMRIL